MTAAASVPHGKHHLLWILVATIATCQKVISCLLSNGPSTHGIQMKCHDGNILQGTKCITKRHNFKEPKCIDCIYVFSFL